jgi:hypothetical protein
MRLSRIDQHIKDEPCAKQRALLGVSSSRFSSVSRENRSTYPIWICLPLVCPNKAEKSKVDYSSKAKTGKSTNVRDFLVAKNTVHGASVVDRST